MTASLEAAFVHLCEKNSLPDAVRQQFLALKCLSVGQFANWVDQRADLKAAFLDATTCKDDPSVLSRLKMAWRQAEAIVEHNLKRQSEGLQDEALDEPLDSGTQSSVQDTFKKRYGWSTLPPARMGAGALLGRIYREFQHNKPTLYALTKVRTLFPGQDREHASPPRRSILGGL